MSLTLSINVIQELQYLLFFSFSINCMAISLRIYNMNHEWHHLHFLCYFLSNNFGMSLLELIFMFESKLP